MGGWRFWRRDRPSGGSRSRGAPAAEPPLPEPVEPQRPDPQRPDPQRPAATRPDELPRSVGRFTLIEELARGGMGAVYLAEDEAGASFAVKLVRPEFVGGRPMARLRIEGKALALLDHPNIARVHETGETDAGEPYFAMEYVRDARSLVEYARERELDLRSRLRLFLDVCDAVEHGHSKGILHRDLKPANLIVDGEGTVKVIDYGVARVTDADVTIASRLTTVGELIGTVLYLSPEQCQGDPDLIDARSDVYALGVVLYELVTDQLPYDVRKKPLYTALRTIETTQPPKPSTLHEGLAKELDAVLLKALEKDAGQRYASAAALADDVRRHLDA